MMRDLKIPATDGFSLAATFYEPDQSNGKIVLIAGATGLRRKYYGAFAQFLTESGFTALTFDYRGIGESRNGSLRKMPARMQDWGIKDLTGVLEWIADHYADYDLLMVTHSVGGILLGITKHNQRVKRALMIVPPILRWQNSDYRASVFIFTHIYLPVTTAIMGYFPGRYVVGDDMPPGIMREWRQWTLSPRYVRDHIPPEQDFFQQMTAPIKAYSFADDQLVARRGVEAALKFYSQAPIQHEHKNVPGVGHTGYFRRQFQDSLWLEALKWLNDDHTASSVSI